jgi:hypothetical protein
VHHIYTHADEQPDVDVLYHVNPRPGAKRFLARVTVGDFTGWLWVDSKAELGRSKDDRKTPLTWAFATEPENGEVVKLRPLTCSELPLWSGQHIKKP